MGGSVFMPDIRKESLTGKLFHFNDKKITQIKSDWFNSVNSKIVSAGEIKNKAKEWFLDSKLNTVTNTQDLKTDLTYGCTDFINNFISREKTYQVLENEYSYYSLFGMKGTPIDQLQPNSIVLVSLPNYNFGNTRPDWDNFTKTCESKNIEIHIDAAWYTATKNFGLDISHPNIKSIAFSITKSGFEWNKFGIRLSKQKTIDPITVRNYNTNWINQNVINCANYIFDNIHVDYPWATHINHYNEICDKLDLDSTNFIHVAKQDGKNVGVAKILEQY